MFVQLKEERCRTNCRIVVLIQILLLEIYKPIKAKLKEIKEYAEKVLTNCFEHIREFMLRNIEIEKHLQGSDTDLLDFNGIYNHMEGYDENTMKLFNLLKEIYKI